MGKDMMELKANTPLDRIVPLTIGAITLRETDGGVMTSLAPYKGQHKSLSDALKAAHGMAMPAPNRATGKDGARAIWFGRDQALLMGPAADAGLARYAACTDQSDAWVCVELKGAGVPDVLARLTPIDLRDSQFKRGHTARTDLMHMASSVTRTGPQSFMVMVFRSMAQTLLHDLEKAMAGVASRG